MTKMNLFNQQKIKLLWLAIFLMTAGCAQVTNSIQPVAPGGLKDAFILKEMPKEEGESPILLKKFSNTVDVNSNVQVNIDSKKVFSALPVSIEDISPQRERLMDILSSCQEYIELTKKVQQLNFELFDEDGKKLYPENNPKYQEFKAIFDRHGKLYSSGIINNILYYIAEINHLSIDPKKRDRPLRDPVFKALVLEKYPFIEFPVNNPNFINFIKKELKKMDERSRKRYKKLAVSSELKLRLQAKLMVKGKASYIPIHIPGYDTLESQAPSYIDKVSFSLDEDGKEQLRNEYNFYKDFAETYNEIKRDRHELNQVVSDELTKLKKGIQNIKNEFLAFLTEYDDSPFEDFKEILRQVETSLEQDSSLQTKANDVRSLLNEIERIDKSVQDISKLINRIKSLPLGNTDPISIMVDFPQAKLKQINELLVGLKKLIDINEDNSILNIAQSMKLKVKQLVKDEQIKKKVGVAIYNQLKKQHVEERMEFLFSFLEKARNEYNSSRVIMLIKTIVEKFPAPLSVAGIAEDKMIGDMPLDDMLLDRSLDQIIPITDIRIIGEKTRREGDSVRFQAKLLRKDESGKEYGVDAEWDFLLTKYGVHAEPSANVIFVDRRHNPSGEKAVNFDAAPAVSWTIRYKARENGGLARAWNFFNPGLGINTALLNFEGGGAELGLGGTFSLFGNFLQVGYGYNLHVDSDNEYFFLGIGLLELIDKTKNLF